MIMSEATFGVSEKQVRKFETNAVPVLGVLAGLLEEWNATDEDARTVKQQTLLKSAWKTARNEIRRCGVVPAADGTLVSA
jgi:hypothetical protein